MRRALGIATTNFLLHVLFVGATVCVLLALVLAVLWAFVWAGLAFPVGLREITQLILAAVVAVAAGLGLYRWGRRRW